MEEKEYLQMLSKLQAACVRREYSVKDICGKALKLSADEDIAGRLVDDLVREGFVDDLRYACAFAREKSSISGWGAAKIEYALRMKGVPRDRIASALDEIDSDAACRRLDRALSAKWKTLSADPQGRFKLIRFALSRGYSYDEVNAALKRLGSCE